MVILATFSLVEQCTTNFLLISPVCTFSVISPSAESVLEIQHIELNFGVAERDSQNLLKANLVKQAAKLIQVVHQSVGPFLAVNLQLCNVRMLNFIARPFLGQQ